MAGWIFVEGHGEIKAVENLVVRLWNSLELPHMYWKLQRRRDLHLQKGIEKAAMIARARNADALLIVRDEDDGCPKELGPEAASWLRRADLPFPGAVILLHREYEVFFLPCIHLMAGEPLRDERGISRPGILPNTTHLGNPEAIRGVKEWLSKRFPPGRSYKPTLDQLPMTRMLDFDVLRAAQLPCFDTLERGLLFLGHNLGRRGVYPPIDV